MTSPRDAAIAAVRPLVAKATEHVPVDVPFALNLGDLVNAVLTAAHPDALLPPRHRPDEEEQTAYRVSEELPGVDDETLAPLYLSLRTSVDGLRPVVGWTITEGTGPAAGLIVEGTTTPANIRLLGMALVAAADHALRVQAQERADATTDQEK